MHTCLGANGLKYNIYVRKCDKQAVDSNHLWMKISKESWIRQNPICIRWLQIDKNSLKLHNDNDGDDDVYEYVCGRMVFDLNFI